MNTYVTLFSNTIEDCGSPVVKQSDHGRHVMSSSPVSLNTLHVGQRRTFNMSRAETSSRWCGVVVRRGGGANSGVLLVTTMVQNNGYIAKSPRVAEECDVNIPSFSYSRDFGDKPLNFF
ncbi:hypothetical protein TNCV_1577811 [Trichonephila clavipes]|nr:hypothetical protein TNCV_1577811 [Trichonephila clavipes]